MAWVARVPAVALGLVLLLLTQGCGGSSSAPESAVGLIAVQPGDLPSGMVRCALSGDVTSFLDREKSADPATYTRFKAEWDAAQQNGATAAYVAVYTDTSAHCSSLESSGADPAGATYPLVVNFVIQFKDEASASGGYDNGSFFDYSVADLQSGGQPVIVGQATGLGANSVVRDADLVSQTWFIALWQNGSYLVILVVVNRSQAQSQVAAARVNGRIK